ncbi:hypothetical protein [Pseudonocardia sp. GCM10023141]|uniref:hypothetical protein n=1 Tax=Pseudonocardia sp. GCM10023141 TaxID=3252653 RepID=UPI00361E5CD5
MRAPRRSAGVAGSVLAVALVIAAGQSSGPPAPGRATSWIAGKPGPIVVRDAADLTRAAGSARIEAGYLFDADGGPTTSSRVTGRYDFGAQVGGFTSTPAGGYAIVTHSAVFVMDPGGQRWMRAGFSAAEQDPSQALDLLRAASGGTREVGTDRLHDTEVHLFAVTVDPRRLAAVAGPVAQGSVVESVTRAGDPVPVNLYVDEQGRVRRLQVWVRVVDSARGPGLVTVTVDLFDFGIDVPVRVPAPDAVGPVQR